MFSFGRSLFSSGATVAPATGPGAAAPSASAAPVSAAPVAPATSRSWGNYLKQGTLLNTKGLERAAAARNTARAAYNANTNNKTKKNAYRKAAEAYAAELRASKKKGNNTSNANAANAEAAALIDSKDAKSKFFDNVLNPRGSAINRYFKRKIDFDIFDNSADMNPEYINNETKGDNFNEYTTERITTKSNSNQTYTDRKETITSYKVVGTQLLNDPNDVYIRIYGMTQNDAKDKLQLYITALRKSLDYDKESALTWAKRKGYLRTAGRAAYTAGVGLAAAPLAAVALPVGLAVGAKGVYKYGLKPAGQCVGAACQAVYNAATGDSKLTNLIKKVDTLIQKVDALTPGAAAGTVAANAAANAAAASRGPSATAALASGSAPTEGGRRPSRRNHKKHTMMTRRKKSKNKKY